MYGSYSRIILRCHIKDCLYDSTLPLCYNKAHLQVPKTKTIPWWKKIITKVKLNRRIINLFLAEGNFSEMKIKSQEKQVGKGKIKSKNPQTKTDVYLVSF